MVAVELDTFHKNENGVIDPKFKVLFRIEIPRSQFTYKNALDRIIQLNDDFDFDWIAIDRGYGEKTYRKCSYLCYIVNMI